MANLNYADLNKQVQDSYPKVVPIKQPVMTPYQPPVSQPTVQQPAPTQQPVQTSYKAPAQSNVGKEGYGYWDTNGWVAGGTAPSATPTTPTAPEPLSVLSSYDLGDNYKSPQDYLKQTELSKAEENKYRQGIMSQYQGEIDAAKTAYSRLLAEQQQLGVGRLGESTATQARRGLIGSSFGTGMTESARATNLKAEQDVLSSQASAIAGIMSRANKAAQDEIDYQRAAKKGGLTEYQKAKSTQSERKKTIAVDVAKSLLLNGIDYKALSADDKKTLTGLGISQQDIINSYLEQKTEQEKEKAKEAAAGAFNLSEGQARYDAQGNVIASKGKTYAPSDSGGGISSGLYGMLGSKASAAAIKEGDKFASQPIVKKYNEIISAANFINAADPNTQNPASHQAIIYNFAKMLDPDSVVREGEYATVKKYSQSLLNKYGGEIKQAATGKGFLSPGAIESIQAETQNRVNAYAPQYNNIKTQYKNRINSLTGQDVGDMVLSDYEAGYTGQGGGSTIIAPDGQEIEIID